MFFHLTAVKILDQYCSQSYLINLKVVITCSDTSFKSCQKSIYVMATTFSILATTSRTFMTLRLGELQQLSSRLTGKMVNLVQFWQPHPFAKYKFAGQHHLLHVANIHLQLVWFQFDIKSLLALYFQLYIVEYSSLLCIALHPPVASH